MLSEQKKFRCENYVPNSSKLELIVIFATFVVGLHIFHLELGQSGAMGASIRGKFKKKFRMHQEKKKEKKKKKRQERHIFLKKKKYDGVVKLR
jgi:hypothetical protein